VSTQILFINPFIPNFYSVFTRFFFTQEKKSQRNPLPRVHRGTQGKKKKKKTLAGPPASLWCRFPPFVCSSSCLPAQQLLQDIQAKPKRKKKTRLLSIFCSHETFLQKKTKTHVFRLFILTHTSEFKHTLHFLLLFFCTLAYSVCLNQTCVSFTLYLLSCIFLFFPKKAHFHILCLLRVFFLLAPSNGKNHCCRVIAGTSRANQTETPRCFFALCFILVLLTLLFCYTHSSFFTLLC